MWPSHQRWSAFQRRPCRGSGAEEGREEDRGWRPWLLIQVPPLTCFVSWPKFLNLSDLSFIIFKVKKKKKIRLRHKNAFKTAEVSGCCVSIWEEEPKTLWTEDLLCARNFARVFNSYYFMFIACFI